MSDFTTNFFQDLVRYHRWANHKLFWLSEGLNDEAFHASAPLGPGSLKATLVHLVGAQRIWLDRWQGRVSGPFPNGEDWTVSKVWQEIESIDNELAIFVQQTLEDDFGKYIDYTNLKGDRFQHRLSDLILHVLNHGVHHRSQILHFLKRQGRSLPGGLDYIFFKLANPSVLQDSETAESCRTFGIEVGHSSQDFNPPDLELIRRYQRYCDWAFKRVLEESQWLNDDQLDRDWSMGQGSLRKTLLHLYDAETWWQFNWQGQAVPFPKSPSNMTIDEVSKKWELMAAERSRLMADFGQNAMGNIVVANFGSGPLHFRFAESMIQLCVHGTLHRAQANNMLRSLGRAVQPLDYVVYIRDNPSSLLQ